jgi:hypothetical protein
MEFHYDKAMSFTDPRTFAINYYKCGQDNMNLTGTCRNEVEPIYKVCSKSQSASWLKL